MDTIVMKQLNAVYEPLSARAKELLNTAKAQGYEVRMGYYPGHSVRTEDGMFFEHYPIPVLTVKGIGDIGLDVRQLFFERTVPRQKALEIDYVALSKRHEMEVYGQDEYLTDFYNETMDAAGTRDRIAASKEEQICVTLYLDAEHPVEKVMALLKEPLE